MAFSDDFASCLASAGINIAASDIPDQQTLQSGLQKLQNWISSLDAVTGSALDEVTADFKVKAGIADPSVNIAPELSGLLRAADGLPVGLGISTLVQRCADCLATLGG